MQPHVGEEIQFTDKLFDPFFKDGVFSYCIEARFIGCQVHCWKEGTCTVQSQGESLGTMLLPNLGESFPEKEKRPLGGGTREVSNSNEIHLSPCLTPHGTAKIYSILYSGGKQWPL